MYVVSSREFHVKSCSWKLQWSLLDIKKGQGDGSNKIEQPINLPLNFFLWKFLKINVFRNKPKTSLKKFAICHKIRLRSFKVQCLEFMNTEKLRLAIYAMSSLINESRNKPFKRMLEFTLWYNFLTAVNYNGFTAFGTSCTFITREETVQIPPSPA